MLAVELLRRYELASATEDASNCADYDCYSHHMRTAAHSGTYANDTGLDLLTAIRVVLSCLGLEDSSPQ